MQMQENPYGIMLAPAKTFMRSPLEEGQAGTIWYVWMHLYCSIWDIKYMYLLFPKSKLVNFKPQYYFFSLQHQPSTGILMTPSSNHHGIS